MNPLAGQGIACGKKPGVLDPQLTGFPLMAGQCSAFPILAAADLFVVNDVYVGGHSDGTTVGPQS